MCVFVKRTCIFNVYIRILRLKDQRKFKLELTAFENELVDKEERLRMAVATRQEFAGQLVTAQQRELALMVTNAELVKTQVSCYTKLLDIAHNLTSTVLKEKFSSDF